MLGWLCCCSCCLILHLGEEKQTIKQRNTLKCKTNMEHKITSHVTFTSLSADSEMLAAASSLTRAIVSAAPAAASAAARRACKKSKWPLVHLFETKVIEKKVLLNALFHKKALVTSWPTDHTAWNYTLQLHETDSWKLTWLLTWQACVQTFPTEVVLHMLTVTLCHRTWPLS